jgi:hypothetical protein
MEPLWVLYRSIWALNLLATALVIWRLFRLGLYKTYRFFLASMTLGLLRSLALFPFSPRSQTYYQIWAWTQPILWLFQVLVVFELYALVLRRYRGIYSVSRIFLIGAIAASAIFSALTVLPTKVASPSEHRVYYYWLTERAVVTSLVVFLALLLVLVAWFAIPLNRNLLTHCLVYSAYFFSNNMVYLYRQIVGSNAAYAHVVVLLSVALACLFCWVFFLTRSGEDRTASLLLGRNPLQEKHLLGQLENLNATLLRTARK